LIDLANNYANIPKIRPYNTYIGNKKKSNFYVVMFEKKNSDLERGEFICY